MLEVVNMIIEIFVMLENYDLDFGILKLILIFPEKLFSSPILQV
jgi:hypothetical protein